MITVILGYMARYFSALRIYEMIEIVSNLKPIREQRKISQQELADISGISVRMIRYYESLDAMPSIINAYKLSQILEVPLDELFPAVDR